MPARAVRGAAYAAHGRALRCACNGMAAVGVLHWVPRARARRRRGHRAARKTIARRTVRRHMRQEDGRRAQGDPGEGDQRFGRIFEAIKADPQNEAYTRAGIGPPYTASAT